MKAVITQSGDNAYAELICRYFTQKFPKIFKASKSDLLEIITEILIGDKNLRFGPVPKVENLAKIRATISRAIELNAPIPALVPWGGRKGDPRFGIDVAEVSALWQLTMMDQTLKRYYEPGLKMNIRIEDLNAHWLYRDEKDAVTNTDLYSDKLAQLIRIVKGDSRIAPVKESDMMDAFEYYGTAERYADLIFDYLTVSDAYPDSALLSPEWKKLESTGWKGTIPTEQREYYTGRYKQWDPRITHMQANRKLADYFGGSKARLELNGKGNPLSDVDGYIQLNFTPPVAGAPAGIFDNTLYLRTVPLYEARTHIAPWRSRGYLQIDDFSGKVVTKIAPFGDHVRIDELIPATTTLSNNDGSLSVELDASQFIDSTGRAIAYATMGAMF